MSTIASTSRPRSDSEAEPSDPRESRPEYRFFFGPATATTSTRDNTEIRQKYLLPDVLLGISAEQRTTALEEVRLPVGTYEYTGSPPTSSSSAAMGNISEGAKEIEKHIEADARNRHYAGLYEMQTNAAVDQCAKEFVASPEVREAFRLVNEARSGIESLLVEKIEELDKAVRRKLGLEGSDYGGLMKIEKFPMATDTARQPRDREVNKLDLVVPRSRSKVLMKLHTLRGSVTQKMECHWECSLSFVEVKTDSSEDCKRSLVLQKDCKRSLVLQSLRYTRKICEYWAPLSHVHFVTWCGNLVRLWYLNRTLYGCTRPFDTRDPKDQEEIVKILRFLSVEEHQIQLCGHWDLPVEKLLHMVPRTVSLGSVSSIQLTGLELLDKRPGPFRSRTCVFVDHGVGSKSTMPMLVKISWQSPHLWLHELEIAREVWNLPKDCGLPYPPKPLGLAVVPIPDFQTDDSEPLTTSGPAPHFPPRKACILVYRQPLGDVIGNQVLPHNLVHIHMELANQLLILATHGFHYRDLNEGNIRILRGSDNKLLIIDLGNMRRNLSPRGNRGLTDAEATIDRAKDDTRSANGLFLPTCCLKVQYAIDYWNKAIDLASSDFESALAAGAGHRFALAQVSASLVDLRSAMQQLATHSHRYIDDLESAVYLYFWRMANYCGLSKPKRRELKELLQLGPEKAKLWSSRPYFGSALKKYCAQASREWNALMRDSWSTISEARAKLDKFLWTNFENQARLSLDCLEVELQTLDWNDDQDVKHNLYRLFENRHLLDETRLNEIERECFEKCSELLRNAEIVIKARSF